MPPCWRNEDRSVCDEKCKIIARIWKGESVHVGERSNKLLECIGKEETCVRTLITGRRGVRGLEWMWVKGCLRGAFANRPFRCCSCSVGGDCC